MKRLNKSQPKKDKNSKRIPWRSDWKVGSFEIKLIPEEKPFQQRGPDPKELNFGNIKQKEWTPKPIYQKDSGTLSVTHL
jgi:hypothetical protein